VPFGIEVNRLAMKSSFWNIVRLLVSWHFVRSDTEDCRARASLAVIIMRTITMIAGIAMNICVLSTQQLPDVIHEQIDRLSCQIMHV
jgi:hypothetical protein